MTDRTPSRAVNIAVLDDDPAMLRLVGVHLQADFGNRIKLTLLGCPEKAREFLDQRACDILISDIEMPGTNGLEILDFAKRRNAWTQVVFMTGYSSWDRISEAVERGASDYLVKPINRGELADIVEGQIARLLRWKRAVVGTLRTQDLSVL